MIESFYLFHPGRYNLLFHALNSVSRAEARHDVRVMHPMRLLDINVKSPLVHAECSLSIIAQGQVRSKDGCRARMSGEKNRYGRIGKRGEMGEPRV